MVHDADWNGPSESATAVTRRPACPVRSAGRARRPGALLRSGRTRWGMTGHRVREPGRPGEYLVRMVLAWGDAVMRQRCLMIRTQLYLFNRQRCQASWPVGPVRAAAARAPRPQAPFRGTRGARY